MKVQLIKLGHIKSKEIDSLCESYLKRLKPLVKVEILTLKDQAGAKGERNSSILSNIGTKPGRKIFLLDERGKKLSSAGYAQFFRSMQENPATKEICLVIGGAFGFSDDVRNSVDGMISFSDMVFPNEIAWLLLVEQTYRAFSILAGSNYHHD